MAQALRSDASVYSDRVAGLAFSTTIGDPVTAMVTSGPVESGEDGPPARGAVTRALLEAVLVGAVAPYLLARGLAVGLADVPLMGWAFDGIREVLASAVLRAIIGWVIYLGLFGLIVKYGALRETLASLRTPAIPEGWWFALITAGIQLFVILTFFVSDRTLLWEASFFNVFMSVGTALAGGVGEEVAYRGVIVLRLKAAGASQAMQIVVSGVLFGLAHASWSGAAAAGGVVAMLMPVLGTAVLGGLFARAFQLSGYRILPVIVAHAALNFVMEPALLLSYFAG